MKLTQIDQINYLTVKKTRTKQKTQSTDSPETASEVCIVVREPLRITRSKIKQEKPSLGSSSVEPKQVEKTVLENTVAEVTISTKSNDTVTTKEKKKKKYPMPILIKLEPTESVADVAAVDSPTPADPHVNDTFNVPLVANETITLSNNEGPALNETVTVLRESLHDNPNATVTIERNAHESLMTEDNDEDEPSTQGNLMAPPLTKKMPQLLLKSDMKLKKNEVFK